MLPTLRRNSSSFVDISNSLKTHQNRLSDVIYLEDNITSDINCLSLAKENYKMNALPAADVIGDITSTISVTKRLLQIKRILLPVSDTFNNGFTVATAFIATVCYIGAAFAIYLDDVKLKRSKNKFKVGLFFLTGVQCGILSAYAPTILALPSFIFCTLVDLGSALENAYVSHKKTIFEGWLEENLQELFNLKEVILKPLPDSEKTSLRSRIEELEQTIQLRYRANNNNSQNKVKINEILEGYQSTWAPGRSVDKDLTLSERIEEEKIKLKLEDEFIDSMVNIVSRTATLMGLAVLEATILSISAFDPLTVATWLGIGAVTHGYVTYKSAFYSPSYDTDKPEKSVFFALKPT